MHQSKLLAISVSCLIGSLASASILTKELRALSMPPRGDVALYEHIAMGKQSFGASSYSKKLALSDCNWALVTHSHAGDDRQRAAIAEACGAMSAEILKSMPTHSHAWYVNSLAQASLGRIEGFLTSYRRSRETGPNEQWLVENRVQLAENMLSYLDANALAYHEADLTLLASTPRGTRTLAKRYASDEFFRDRITNIILRLSPDRQRAFLSNVRKTIR